jgi:hypothetical protein
MTRPSIVVRLKADATYADTVVVSGFSRTSQPVLLFDVEIGVHQRWR